MEPGKGACSTCLNLIRQCGGMDFFPSDPEIRKLLAERLHRIARSHDHAEKMIDHWLVTQTMAPKVADLVALASEIASQSTSLPAGCELCGGGYWAVSDRGAKRCTCARGQALRAADEARHAA